jgi:4-amino-4-deoxy-L-arabinose transferase-like glycosyltransferase
MAVLFCGIFGRDLWTPDEPRVAAICVDMSRTGDWVVPYLAQEPFIEKPPLYFVFGALGVRALSGLDAGSVVRLTTAIWGALTLWVAFLFVRRFRDKQTAWLTVLFLATMSGYVENTHWVRVDAAMMFFVIASLWAFAEAYFFKRPWMLLLAGVFTAGTFLTKGLIGVIYVAVGWLGLAVPWINQLRKDKQGVVKALHVPQHLLAALVLLAGAGTWVVLLRVQGGEELWHEWFWVNHVGRLDGTASHLGHIRTGEPLYYVNALVTYALPWLLLTLLWTGRALQALFRRQRLDAFSCFLLISMVGSMAFLNASATKRSLYLLPLLPMLAMAAADAMRTQLPRWIRSFYVFWSGLCLLVLLLVPFVPLAMRWIPVEEAPRAMGFLGSWSVNYFMALLLVAVAVIIAVRRKAFALPEGPIALTGLVYLVVMLLAGHAVDLEKSMQTGFEQFAGSIPEGERPRTASWNLSETVRGAFYYYIDWSVPRIQEEERVAAILTGNDAEYDAIIVEGRYLPEDIIPPGAEVTVQVTPGSSSRRTLRLIRAASTGEPPEQ